jgi:Tol biopolymer transport system component
LQTLDYCRGVKTGICSLTLGFAALLVLAFASAASSSGGQTQIVVIGGPGFLTETLDGTITGSVATAPGTFPGTYSAAANGSIAYDDSNGAGGIWIVSPAQPPVELDSSPNDSDVAISPDGWKVAFARYDVATDTSDLYVVNANGSGLALVASGDGNNNLSFPSFSPDGSTIAYKCRSGNYAPGTGIGCGPTSTGTYTTGGLMLVNADGSDRRMILSYISGTEGDSLSWSPDGQSIALSEVPDQGGGPSEVFVYRTDGSDLLDYADPSRQVTHDADAGYFPHFSPDGTEIIFEKVVDNHWVFFTIDPNGTNEQELSSLSGGQFEVVPPASGGGPPATVDVGQPLPAPDGPVLVHSWISQCDGYLVETAADAFTACVPGHGRTGFYSNTSIAVASDDSVVYSDLSAGPGGAEGPIWLSRPNTAPVELDSSVYDFEPSITSDGSQVTFARLDPASGTSDLYVVNADGSDLKLIASGAGSNRMYLSSPAFSPDGGSIAYLCSSVDGSSTETATTCGPLFDGTFRAGGLMLMNADGTDARMIVTGGGDNLSWSPDGQWLATTGSSGVSQVFAYHTDGSDIFMANDPSRQITNATGSSGGAGDPQFSPDGSQILYSSSLDDNGDFGSFQYVIGRDGTGRHEVFLAPLDLSFSPPGLFVPQHGGGGPSATVAPTQAPVPNVTSLGYHAAKIKLAARLFAAKVARRAYSSRVRQGHVISQSPRAHTVTGVDQHSATVVKLVLSRGRRPRHHHR